MKVWWFLGSVGVGAIVVIVALALHSTLAGYRPDWQEKKKPPKGDDFERDWQAATGTATATEEGDDFERDWQAAEALQAPEKPERPVATPEVDLGGGRSQNPRPPHGGIGEPVGSVAPLRYDWTRSSVASFDQNQARYIAHLVDSLSNGLRTTVRVAAAMPVVHLYCGSVGRDAYLPAAHSIRLCDETLEWFVEFSRTSMWKGQALWFILGHELAHAIIETRRLPIVGDTEAAVDELAGLLLLESGFSTAGGELFLHAVSENENDWALYTHHGSSLQRANRLSCLNAGEIFDLLTAGPVPQNDEDQADLEADLAASRASNRRVLGSAARLAECEAQDPVVRGKWRRLLGNSWIGRH